MRTGPGSSAHWTTRRNLIETAQWIAWVSYTITAGDGSNAYATGQWGLDSAIEQRRDAPARPEQRGE